MENRIINEYPGEEYLMGVRDNFLRIREEVENARARLGLDYEIEICAATKTVAPDVINTIVPYGLSRIGENRMQELDEKYDSYDSSLTLDFIGTLQSNKIRHLAGRVSLIQSLATESAAAELERVSAARGIISDVLIEINSGKEENKSGIMPEMAADFAALVSSYSHINLRGLMTVGAISADAAEYRKYFEETFRLYIDISNKNVHNNSQGILSMGMSDNYIEAIECGATMIRPGRAIFGARPKKI